MRWFSLGLMALALTACTAGKDDPTLIDDDGDGYTLDEDCNDSDASVNPGADEVCDGMDNNCDGITDDDAVDAIAFFADTDGDLYGDANVTEIACEAPEGFVEDSTDCNDTLSQVNPGAAEVCDADNLDEDCDGDADDDDDSATGKTTYYVDNDSDSFGDENDTGMEYCDPPAGLVTDNTDCDDSTDGGTINPDAVEVCDAADTDENCDGKAENEATDNDPATQTRYFPDTDMDYFGDKDSAGTLYCDDPSSETDWWSLDNTDCNDAASAINPAANEVCDTDDVDEDCDGYADDEDDDTLASTMDRYHEDNDKDKYGAEGRGITFCDDPTTTSDWWSLDNTDCNDDEASVNPAATEVCDAADVDEDCDGYADDDDTSATGKTTYYADNDGDLYGDDDDAGTDYCDAPTGMVADNTDCDDSSTGGAINPGATEVCDAADVDEDCNGDADDADASATGKSTYYVDNDSDTYGDETDAGTDYCDAPTGMVADNTDCDDSSTGGGINPGEIDIPQDTIDQDCDGTDAPYSVSDLATGDLVITEFMQNPSAVLDDDGEWFEIYNNSGGTVDIEGLYVYDDGSNSFTVADSITFNDGEYLVLGCNEDTATNGGVNVDYEYSYSAMAQSNGSDEIYLAESSTKLIVIDEVMWDNGATFPDPNGASSSLVESHIDSIENDDGAYWCVGDTSYGDGDLGTPGAENDCLYTIGWDVEGGTTGSYAANYLLGYPITVSSSFTLEEFALIAKGTSANVMMALYDDTGTGGGPGALVASTAASTLALGDNRFSTTATTIAPGTYYLAAVYNNSAQISYGVGTSTGYYRVLTFGSLPATFGTASAYTSTVANYYLVGY